MDTCDKGFINQELTIQKWIRISLLNLGLVALLGVIMRYKIAFSFPLINQKNFLHAHSHFAFSGWLSQVLMVLMVQYLSCEHGNSAFKRYKWILIANLVSAYGMLLSFPFQGYGFVSITFSTLSIFVFYFFAFMFWKDINTLKVKNITHYWFKTALIFGIISSIGTFTLSGLMATKTIHQNWYLMSIYFYLHFQYNGWFFFTSMGLLVDKITKYNVSANLMKLIFWLLASACIPAYILSILWLKLPMWVYSIVVIAALAQLVAIILFIQVIWHCKIFTTSITPIAKKMFMLSGFALIIKIILQLGSTIPAISQLAFGFRPIVIAYLHLVLLGVFTIFILGYIILQNYISINKKTFAGIIIFTLGIIVNEIVLMVQGIGDLYFVSIPYTNQLLLSTALIMLTGISLLCINQKKRKVQNELKVQI